MIRINLLQAAPVEVTEASLAPESPGAANKRAFGLALLGAIVLLGAAYWFVTGRLSRLNEQIDEQKREADALSAIQAENARLSAELQDIKRRTEALQLLQEKRQSPEPLMTQLALMVNHAPGLYLLSVSPQGNRLNMSGASTSVNSIAALVRDLLTQGFADVQLREYYEDDEKDGTVSFRFLMDVAYPGLGINAATSPVAAAPKPGPAVQPVSHGT